MSPSTYATPGVYVEEISTLPPSIAEVATAIPAFIGTTSNHAGKSPVIAEISSLREYEEKFGVATPTHWQVTFEPSNGSFTITMKDKAVDRFSQPESLLWYCIDLYFRNGGGRCYIASVPSASTSAELKKQLENGIDELERFDEPTLLLIPEAITLSDADYSSVCKKALAHAAKLKDRFVLLDALPSSSNNLGSTDLQAMREPLGTTNLDRGALYYPFLRTSLTHRIDEELITVSGLPIESANPAAGDAAAATGSKSKAAAANTEAATTVTLQSLSSSQTAAYNTIQKQLSEQRILLPPSAAIAGVITSVDRERGVWKAPANVSLQGVIAPSLQVTDEQQALLNVDATTGKSVNVIRSFAGKGTLVWGARTLAGNDNEWRYISVRRLFITIEESVKKATSFAVFEANDTSTWLKVKGMIDSYLYSLWERGALRGTKSEDAYFVNVGLNKTMTNDDILNGRLIVEIGLAAVRPAEFILLRFSHKLAQ
ncbi:MAG: phage tail sheath C-terminal domain-containing protein [Synechococcaceae cyanobacterium]|nr:phage tail sheath C-terminal domain-containing protein [Synechococcaceae cyanobacterium]